MKNIKLYNTSYEASCAIMGCSRVESLSLSDLDTLVKTAMDMGINYFDHTDSDLGLTEKYFSDAVKMTDNFREKIILQTKCGLGDNVNDLSKTSIISTVDNSLSKLNTDYIDVVLLHHINEVMEPSEIAEALSPLSATGKVRYFGVCDFNAVEIELLKEYTGQDILTNQIEFDLANYTLLDKASPNIFEYAQFSNMTLQCYSPFNNGLFEDALIEDNEFSPHLHTALIKIAEKYDVPIAAIMTSWILSTPGPLQVVIGANNVNRLKYGCMGVDITLSNDEWQELYHAAKAK